MSSKRSKRPTDPGAPKPPAAGAGAVSPAFLVPYGVVAVLAALLIGLFVRALPDAVHREQSGRDNYLEAVCGNALNAEPISSLGPLPQPAPDFTLKDWAGRDVRLSSLKGRVVLLNFWATWCPPCRAEVPSLERLVAAEKDKPFTMLAVSVDDNWSAVRSFFRSGTDLTVLLDSKEDVPRLYGTEKFPETFLIDREGRVRFYVVSNREWDSQDIQACVDALEKDG